MSSALRSATAPRVLLLSLVIVIAALLTTVSSVSATARPPKPAGSQALAPGHIPRVCTGGTFNAYASNYGVYYSARAKAWISAPWCVPRWGNLEALTSGITKVKGSYTVTAVPNEGSNSAQYAPETKSISWTYPGKRVSGCGSADLSCTVVPFSKGTDEWQWGEFHVTMPRTFFVDSAGSNCAGQHLCAGFSTNAWGFVGVPPADKAVITGTVSEKPECSSSCSTTKPGVGGVKVAVAGTKHYSTTTEADGTYSVEVAKGTYTVTVSKSKTLFAPTTRKVKASSVTKGIDFEACGAPAHGRSARAAANGDYSVPPGISVPNGTFTDDNYGCLHHRASAKVNGSTITVAFDAQLACPKATVQSTNIATYRQDFTFVFTGMAPGVAKKVQATGQPTVILEVAVPKAPAPDNVLGLTYFAARFSRPGSFGVCEAGFNRPIESTTVDTPLLTLGGAPFASLPPNTTP